MKTAAEKAKTDATNAAAAQLFHSNYAQTANTPAAVNSWVVPGISMASGGSPPSALDTRRAERAAAPTAPPAIFPTSTSLVKTPKVKKNKPQLGLESAIGDADIYAKIMASLNGLLGQSQPQQPLNQTWVPGLNLGSNYAPYGASSFSPQANQTPSIQSLFGGSGGSSDFGSWLMNLLGGGASQPATPAAPQSLKDYYGSAYQGRLADHLIPAGGHTDKRLQPNAFQSGTRF